MKRSTKYKFSSILFLGLVLIGYNQCVSPMSGTTNKSAMKFAPKDKLTNKVYGPNNTGSTLSSAEVKLLSIAAFNKTVYPITKARCASCHGASQTPLHASSDIDTAYNAIIDSFKIDFNNIPSSRMVLKLKVDRHNCWGDCSANATEMQNQITQWKSLIEVSAPEATEVTNNVSGKTTKDTETVSEILNPSNLIDQGTITLMAESGSLRLPMTKATTGATTYIWAPEGTGTKTLTSSDAGLASINFKLTNSDFYKVWMLVDAPDNSSDSAFVKVAGSDTKEWHIKATKGFEWREVTHTTNFEDSPFYISGGTNFRVEIRQRDDGLKISKITITSDVNFNPTVQKAMKSTISMPLVDLSGVAGSMLDIDIEEYDMYSYKMTNPRIRSDQDIYVKGLKVLLNGSFNPQHSTYTIVNKKITPDDGNLSTYSMIVLKDKGSEYDRLSFSFDHIGKSPAPIVVTPAKVTSTSPTSSTPTATVVSKLTSLQGFQQTLWPVLRARCMNCHGNIQPPLHSHAVVSTAHQNVIESSLVNFTTVSNSKIATKLRVNKHNCWSDCNSNAAEIEGQINIWKNLSGK